MCNPNTKTSLFSGNDLTLVELDGWWRYKVHLSILALILINDKSIHQFTW